MLTVQSLADIRENNDAAREALAAIAKHRDEFLDAKNKMAAQEARIGHEPPQLAADLEAAAKRGGHRTSPRPSRGRRCPWANATWSTAWT